MHREGAGESAERKRRTKRGRGTEGEKRLIRSVVRSEMERGAKETETCRRQCVERGEAGADQKKKEKGRTLQFIDRPTVRAATRGVK